MNNQNTGQLGENLACAYLLNQNYQQLDRNWRCRLGEVDLVMLTQQRDLVFVEVKTRRSQRCGTPAAAITPKKLARMRKVAGNWLQEHEVSFRKMRLDVVGITWSPGGRVLIDHREGVS